MCPVGVEKNHAGIVARAREQKVAHEGEHILHAAVIQVLAYLKSNAKQKSIMRFRDLRLHEQGHVAKNKIIEELLGNN